MARVFPVALGLLLALSAPAAAQAPPSLDEVMTRVAAYMRVYAQDYTATIAAEHYAQFASGRRTVLDAEFGIVRLPGHEQWLGFRDVVRVNGSLVGDRESRLARLFAGTDTTGFSQSMAAQASNIVAESVRFNIGPIVRTVNSPAVVLELLDPRHHSSFVFSKMGEENLGDMHAWRIRFEERGRPTVISTTKNADLPVTGELWVDPSSGRLLRADIAIRFTVIGRGGGRIIRGSVSVTFKEVPELQLWLPDRMTERYDEAFGRPLQSGDATYTRYRRFRVESQENVELPPVKP